MVRQISVMESLFKALADETRLRILGLLLTGEVCVCDIHESLGLPQPTTSRHLAYLRRAGLVQARKPGLWHYYTLTSPRGSFHTKLLECLACCFNDVPELAKDTARLGRKSCSGSSDCCPR